MICVPKVCTLVLFIMMSSTCIYLDLIMYMITWCLNPDTVCTSKRLHLWPQELSTW